MRHEVLRQSWRQFGKTAVKLLPIRRFYSESRFNNVVKIQMLSKNLHEQVFPNCNDTEEPAPDVVWKIRNNLRKHDLWRKGDVMKDVVLSLPPLQGNNIAEHFYNIGLECSEPYLSQARKLAEIAELPPKPQIWSYQQGWTRYAVEGGLMTAKAVPCPLESTVVFDVETCVVEGPYPVLACAVSKEAWYSWTSSWLIHFDSQQMKTSSSQGEMEGLDATGIEEGILPGKLYPAVRKLFRQAVKESVHVLESRDCDAFRKEVVNKMQSWTENYPSTVRQELDVLWDDYFQVINISDWIKEEENAAELSPKERILDKPFRNKQTRNRPELIPFSGGNVPTMQRLLIGHFVSFDRARVLDEYSIAGTSIRYMDTMSMHIATSGMTSGQRMMYMKAVKNAKEKEVVEEMGQESPPPTVARGDRLSHIRLDDDGETWVSMTSLNSLRDVFKLHCGGDLSKDARDVFVKGDMKEIQEQFQELTSYCASDVEATFMVYRCLFPQLLDVCPHPVSFAGMLEMASMYLPVTEKWNDYIKNCDKLYSALQEEFQREVNELMVKDIEKYANDIEGRDQNPWLKHLDWTPVPVPRKAKTKKIRIPGLPAWYHELLNLTRETAYGDIPTLEEFFAFQLEKQRFWTRILCRFHWGTEKWKYSTILPDISPKKRCIPYILRLKWRGYPLHFLQESPGDGSRIVSHGWGYLVPKNEEHASDLIPRSYDDQHHWYPIPHRDGPDANCGNPLAKGYLSSIEQGLLTSDFPTAKKGLEISVVGSYWHSVESRIKGQFVVWSSQCPRLCPRNCDLQLGAIIPKVIVAGTVTRRAVENTWLTASNAKKNRIGSELKAMVKAPPGYNFVGADVDSQELWISAIIGDSRFGNMHGCTPFGWMTLQGKKSDKTDLHSKTAEIINISRDQAKVFNYGRIYGAGKSFAAQLLKQFNKALTEEEATRKANLLYSSTKGFKSYVIAPEKLSTFLEALGNMERVPRSEPGFRYRHVKAALEALYPSILDFPTAFKRFVKDGFVKEILWSGGTESEMFVGLEKIANDHPETPFLGCKISAPLRPNVVNNQFLTSRVNWVVQSSAVDYLHLMLVSMKWLMKKYSIQGRFCISIHDEVRYLVVEEDAERAALALHITNLWVRSFFSHRLNMRDLPLSVAFFSSVDIDHVLRKEVDLTCETPSHPEAVPPGRGLDIYEAVRRTNGKLEKPKHVTEKRRNCQYAKAT